MKITIHRPATKTVMLTAESFASFVRDWVSAQGIDPDGATLTCDSGSADIARPLSPLPADFHHLHLFADHPSDRAFQQELRDVLCSAPGAAEVARSTPATPAPAPPPPAPGQDADPSDAWQQVLSRLGPLDAHSLALVKLMFRLHPEECLARLPAAKSSATADPTINHQATVQPCPSCGACHAATQAVSEPFAPMSAAKIRELRERLLSSMHSALADATENDNRGRPMLAVKFGGRACGIEHAIELLDMIESQPNLS